jgi:hypothetical protein
MGTYMEGGYLDSLEVGPVADSLEGDPVEPPSLL